jgi:large subunit ribosomal protein L24
MKIRKGDRVKVIAGRSKGKVGDVLRVLPSDERVVVSGVNMIKRHTKPGRTEQGGIVEREAAIHVSNLMLVCPECGKPTRVQRAVSGDGVKTRSCKKCKATVDRKASA